VVVAAAVGYDRRIQGRPAGVRTTLLVALAACFAMIQANWLISTVGKQTTSFVTMDIMRMPLGILTGVGFIGGGAILKRGDTVSGLTTAATLWFVSVIGLCVSGGQLWLGGGGGVLGYLILHGLDRLERRLRQERPVELNLRWRQDAFDVGAALAAVRDAGVQVADFDLKRNVPERVEQLRCSLRRLSLPDDHSVPPAIVSLAEREGVLEWEWKD